MAILTGPPCTRVKLEKGILGNMSRLSLKPKQNTGKLGFFFIQVFLYKANVIHSDYQNIKTVKIKMP